MARVLYLSQRIPFPPHKGEKIRPWQFLRHMARDHEVHFGCLMDDPDDWQHRPRIQALCRDTCFAPLDPRLARVRCLAGLATGEPLSVRFFRSARLMRWVRRVIDGVAPDLIVIFSSCMAQYVPRAAFRARPTIMDFADVDSEKWRAYGAETTGAMGWVYRREARRVLAFDRDIARAAAASLFVSEPEAALFRSLAPESAAKVHSIANGVDADYFSPRHHFERPFNGAGPVFVFTGSMDYKPNVDAVTWFAERILPALRGTAPATEFCIVGGRPAAAVQRLAARPGVTVTGRVPDVRPYLAHATAAVAPMFIARGIQNKVLEAMAMARPMVTTTDGLTGIEAEAGAEVVVVDDAAGFVAACQRIAAGGAAAAIGAGARDRVVRDYSWAAQLERFDQIAARTLRCGDAPV